MDRAALIHCVKLDYTVIDVLWSVPSVHTQTGILKSCRATSTHQGHWLCVCARVACVTWHESAFILFISVQNHTDPQKAVNISLEHRSISSNIHHVTAMTGKKTTWPLPCLIPVLFSEVWRLAKIQLCEFQGSEERAQAGWASLTQTRRTLSSWTGAVCRNKAVKIYFNPPRVLPKAKKPRCT